MLSQFLGGGLIIAGMYLFLVFSMFFKAGATLIALSILAVAIAGQIFRKHWKNFEKQNPYPPDADRFIGAVMMLFGLFTMLAMAVFIVVLLVTGNLAMTLKLTALLECLFLLECMLLSAQL